MIYSPFSRAKVNQDVYYRLYDTFGTFDTGFPEVKTQPPTASLLYNIPQVSSWQYVSGFTNGFSEGLSTTLGLYYVTGTSAFNITDNPLASPTWVVSGIIKFDQPNLIMSSFNIDLSSYRFTSTFDHGNSAGDITNYIKTGSKTYNLSSNINASNDSVSSYYTLYHTPPEASAVWVVAASSGNLKLEQNWAASGTNIALKYGASQAVGTYDLTIPAGISAGEVFLSSVNLTLGDCKYTHTVDQNLSSFYITQFENQGTLSQTLSTNRNGTQGTWTTVPSTANWELLTISGCAVGNDLSGVLQYQQYKSIKLNTTNDITATASIPSNSYLLSTFYLEFDGNKWMYPFSTATSATDYVTFINNGILYKELSANSPNIVGRVVMQPFSITYTVSTNNFFDTSIDFTGYYSYATVGEGLSIIPVSAYRWFNGDSIIGPSSYFYTTCATDLFFTKYLDEGIKSVTVTAIFENGLTNTNTYNNVINVSTIYETLTSEG